MDVIVAVVGPIVEFALEILRLHGPSWIGEEVNRGRGEGLEGFALALGRLLTTIPTQRRTLTNYCKPSRRYAFPFAAECTSLMPGSC